MPAAVFGNGPILKWAITLLLNDYDNGGLQQTFYTQRPFVNVDINFLKSFYLTANWNFYKYSDAAQTIENKYSFLNGTLYFQEGDSPWEFSLQATNVLNTQFTNSDRFSDEFNTTSQYYVLPRIVLFVVKYNL